jgi:dihydrofolate reductase
VARLKAQPGFDMDVGGPTLAATLIQAGLVDEYRLYVNPVILGGGRPFYPALEAPEELRLVETRQFGGGVVFLRYEAVSDETLPVPDSWSRTSSGEPVPNAVRAVRLSRIGH